MTRIVGLDIGSGYTKCYDGAHRVIFPSVYSYRQANIWEEKDGIVEGIGENALSIAQHPNAVKLYPIIEGKPQHQTFIKLAQEALNRLSINPFEKARLISGVPYETGRVERENIKELFLQNLDVQDATIYPQSTGTLFDLELQSGTIINVGHGTTEILVVEMRNLLTGMSEPLASDYVITGLSNHIQAKYGFKPTLEDVIALMNGNSDYVTAFGKVTVHRADVTRLIAESIRHLAEKVSYDVRYLISQLPANMECTRNLVLSGGGSLIPGLRDALKEQLKTSLLAPEDPIFSNALGFYKMGQMLYG